VLTRRAPKSRRVLAAGGQQRRLFGARRVSTKLRLLSLENALNARTGREPATGRGSLPLPF